jgi:hypothetical protein
MTRLTNIATRQRSTRFRDVFFALGIAAASIVSITAVTTACQAATTTTHAK